MGENNRKTELLVGLFLLVGLLLLGGLILQFSRFREAFKENYALTVTFPSAGGITSGSPIKLGGLRVGTVSDDPQPTADFNGVTIPLSVFQEFQIPVGSVFQVGTDGLMGDALVSISTPDGGAKAGFIPAGSQVDGRKAGGLGALEEVAEELTGKTLLVLEDVQGAIAGLTDTLGNLDRGFLGEENAEKFNDSLVKLNGAIGKLDSEVLGSENTDNLSETINDVREAAASIRDTSSKLSPAVEKTGALIDQGGETMESLSAAVTSLEATASEATALLREIRTGDGLASALLTDPVLREDFRALISNLRSRGVLRYRDEASAGQGGAPAEEYESYEAPRRGGSVFPWQR